MDQQEAVIKLKALHGRLQEEFSNPRANFFPTPVGIEYFHLFAPIRDFLRECMPGLLDDFPVREPPTPSETSDFKGLGYITRAQLESLAKDMRHMIGIVDAVPVAVAPSMKVTKEGVYFAGQQFDAMRQVAELVASAKSLIILVDGWIGSETLGVLAGKNPQATVRILTKLLKPDVRILAEAFRQQHGHLEIRASGAFHDRFLFIDDQEFFHFGASIKDLGKRGFMFSRVEEPVIIESVRQEFSKEWAVSSRLL